MKHLPSLLFVAALVALVIYVLRSFIVTGSFPTTVAFIGAMVSLLALYWVWVDFIGPSLRPKD